MTTQADDSCPDPATLGAFVDGSLPRERAQEITRHVSLCARCRVIVERACEVEKDLDHDEIVPTAGGSTRFRWIGALAAAIALAVIGLTLMREWRGSNHSDPIAQLVAASPRSVRSIESRVTGGFPWAPPRSFRRLGAAEKTADELVASGVAGSVLRALEGKRTPEALHAAGVAYLVAGDARAAVGLLTDATARAEKDARIWCDLSAALYASSMPDDRIVMTRALDAADRAIRLDPHLLEAHFNRALILERVGTPQQAMDAWRVYLQRDPTGPWAAEARRHLKNLQP